MEKKKIKSQKLDIDFFSILSAVPGIVYWKNVNSVYLGGNQNCANLFGLKSIKEIYGKDDYHLSWGQKDRRIADEFVRDDKTVMESGKRLVVENNLGVKNSAGLEIIVRTEKTPLRDKTGKTIGVLGIAVDITDNKEAERLKNEAHKAQLMEQQRFKEIAEQLAHDIRSPLASLLMLVKSCSELPESERIAFREVAMTIEDIANDLLNKYKKQEPNSEIEMRRPVLVSTLLLQLLTDKKYQYKELSIKFDHSFTQQGNFAFIKIETTSLKRSVSNIINNAVDSLEGKPGKITLKLDATKEWVKVIIQDNGKGMPPKLVDKIMKNIAVTEGKKDGHGIGLTQVRETLQRNQAELSIDSTLGKGTKIILTFPRITAPSWIAESINLGKEDTVVILDDDSSIHAAWDAHFEEILQKEPNIKLKHFQKGREALEFINTLTPQDKEKIFLLTDYELLKQELNGLQVVKKGHVRRSILVTSHYASTTILEQAAKTGTQILPKQLASEIPIIIDETIKYSEDATVNLKHTDLVIIDDDERYVRNMIDLVFVDLSVDHYTSPEHFLTIAKQYPKDTKICLDQNFNDSRMDGLYLAEQLNKLGYTKLFLISGEEFDKRKMPKYLTVLKKSNIEEVKKY